MNVGAGDIGGAQEQLDEKGATMKRKFATLVRTALTRLIMFVVTGCGRSRRAPSTSRLFLAGLLVASLGFLGTAAAQLQDQLSQPRRQSQRLQSVRRIPIEPHRTGGALQTNVDPQCNSPLVSYFGGPVISNTQIVGVYWNSNVNAAAQPGRPGFFEGITDSTYYDSLSEYSTNVES